MRFIYALIFWIVVAIIAFFAFAFSGMYQVGADVPHWSITRHAIGMVRENAIERRVADIKPPPLDDPALVKLGAEHYSEMCTGCHLAPGMGHSDLRDGLNPTPPNLTRFAPDSAEAFWVIKHGLKMTAMPAWGKTHDDHAIWAMVAYLQKQPRMSAAEYHMLTAGAGAVEHGHMTPATGEPEPAATAGGPVPAAGTAVPAPAATTH
ncbi:MAG TPA: cytochrome c [Rhodanobacteraceae bacterium]|nr:cytochrome c [Rhodanobacteraceae bacterium]